MSRLRELIDELCPDGVEYKTLGSLGQFFGGLSGKTKADFGEGYPFVTYMNVFNNAKVKPEMVDRVRIVSGERQNMLHLGDVLFTVSSETPDECGMSSVVTFEPDGPLFLNSFCTGWRPNDSRLVPDYLAYVLRSWELRKQISKTANGVIRFNVSKPLLADVKVPVPPIEVQREVVRILDSFQELDDALTAEIEAREKQYRFAQEKCFAKYFGNPAPNKPTADTVRLGNLYDVTSSQRIYQSEQSSCGVPFLRVSDLIAKMDGRPWESSLFITEDLYQSLIDTDNVPKPGDILITARGTLGRYYFIKEDDRFYFQDGMITWMRATKDSPSHAFFSALFSNEIFLDRLIANCGQGTVKYLSIKGLSNTLIPKPDASRLEAFDSEMSQYGLIAQLALNLRSERDARRMQFEYYRNKLLSFPEKEA